MSSFLFGLLSVAAATIVWGLQFPVAADVFITVDPFFITSIRYLLASLILFLFIFFLKNEEFSLRGRFNLRVFSIGIIGMGLSPILVFWGISMSTAEQAAIIVATQPSIAVIIHWGFLKKKPAAFVLICTAIAFLGVLLVITKGKTDFMAQQNTLFGNMITFAGASMWVIYSIETSKWDGLRSRDLTLLTMLPGTFFIVSLTALLGYLGFAKAPEVSDLTNVGWEIFYLSIVGVLFGMVAWNHGNQRIGALNSTLFINLIPIAAFGMRAFEGQTYLFIEIFGAFLVILALVLSNFYNRLVLKGTLKSPMQKAEEVEK